MRWSRADGGWVLLALGLSILEVFLRPELSLSQPRTWVALALPLTLLARRHLPLAMVAIAFGAQLVLDLLGPDRVGTPEYPNAIGFLLLLPHALHRWGRSREIWVGTLIVGAVTAASLAIDRSPLPDIIAITAILTAAMAWGTTGRLRDRAEALAMAHAKSRERERLARELHDTVAHHVSAIAIRAQAGQALASLKPEAVDEALRVVEAEAQRGLAEIRSLVGDGAPSDEADLEQLAQSGPPRVTVTKRGDVDALSPLVAETLFRIAREAVANARTHADDVSEVTIEMAESDPGVQLTIANDGAKLHREVTPGYGLRGMRERAELLGGSCTWSARPRGGFEVQVSLPMRESP